MIHSTKGMDKVGAIHWFKHHLDHRRAFYVRLSTWADKPVRVRSIQSHHFFAYGSDYLYKINNPDGYWILEESPTDEDLANAEPTHDPVDHPKHYTDHPSGVECIQITEHMGFNLGNAMKYIWRCDLKQKSIEDLKKAAWYIQREIEKREKLEGER